MVPLPSPPTDSLYKFLAISGLLLAGVGCIAPLVLAQDFTDRNLRRRLESEERMRSLVFKLAELRQKDEPGDEQKRPQVAKDMERSVADMMEREAEQFNSELQANKLVLELQAERATLARAAGGFLMGMGFLWWWRNSQRHQDELLRAELEKRRLELDGLKRVAAAAATPTARAVSDDARTAA